MTKISATEAKKRLLKELNFKVQDILTIDCLPHSHARESCCYENVKQSVSRFGGEIIFGWMLKYTFNKNILEAIPHAIWYSNEDELLCITPHIDNSNTIEFIKDNKNVTGKFLDNKRVALLDTEKIHSIIYLNEINFQLKKLYLSVFDEAFGSEIINSITYDNNNRKVTIVCNNQTKNFNHIIYDLIHNSTSLQYKIHLLSTKFDYLDDLNKDIMFFEKALEYFKYFKAHYPLEFQ